MRIVSGTALREAFTSTDARRVSTCTASPWILDRERSAGAGDTDGARRAREHDLVVLHRRSRAAPVASVIRACAVARVEPRCARVRSKRRLGILKRQVDRRRVGDRQRAVPVRAGDDPVTLASAGRRRVSVELQIRQARGVRSTRRLAWLRPGPRSCVGHARQSGKRPVVPSRGAFARSASTDADVVLRRASFARRSGGPIASSGPFGLDRAARSRCRRVPRRAPSRGQRSEILRFGRRAAASGMVPSVVTVALRALASRLFAEMVHERREREPPPSFGGRRRSSW